MLCQDVLRSLLILMTSSVLQEPFFWHYPECSSKPVHALAGWLGDPEDKRTAIPQPTDPFRSSAFWLTSTMPL